MPQALGSPPQVRGKRTNDVNYTLTLGITPAGAGKTGRTSGICTAAKGSPPQVRGKPAVGLDSIYARRITPAGAGKTYNQNMKYDVIEDHPRRCGEN